MGQASSCQGKVVLCKKVSCWELALSIHLCRQHTIAEPAFLTVSQMATAPHERDQALLMQVAVQRHAALRRQHLRRRGGQSLSSL